MSKKRSRGTGARVEPPREAHATNEAGSLTIGTARVFGVKELTTGIENHAATARFALPIDSLRASAADYRGLVHSTDPQIGGYVVSAAVDATDVHITATTATVLDETRIEYLSHSGVPIPEIVWSMTQIGGLPDDGRFIQGFAKRPSTFAVVIPIAGVNGDRAYQIGPVVIFGNRATVAAMLANLGDPVHAGGFLGQSAWAMVEVKAGTLWEAETAGVGMIELAIDRLAVGAQYSLAANPAGEVIPFARDSLFANPVVLPFVLVTEKATDAPPRRWLRDRSPRVRVVPVSAVRVAFESPSPQQRPEFDEAVRAWRRAVLGTDPMAAVLALWEAIDFYASGMSVPCLSDEEASALRKALDSVTLSDEKRRRVNDLFATINEAPLLVRLRAALAADQVPHTEEDLAVLKRLRKQRNDALHGRQRGRPDSNDLDLARGFVNRMIVFWATGRRLGKDRA